jgi:hypothetical protein
MGAVRKRLTFSPNKKISIDRKNIKKMMMKMNLNCGYKTITSCSSLALSNKNGPLAGGRSNYAKNAMRA